MEDWIKEVIENGESEVQLTTIGKVFGTGANGEPVEQNLTEEALQKLVEVHKDDEILVDVDHESEMGGKTEAKGWLSKLFVKPGKGLFGTIKWTDIGRKLIENRVFRWLSPSWYLSKETNEPIEMTSVALTNKPSQKGRLEPIINSAPTKLEGIKKDILDMTNEELTKLIVDEVSKAVEALKEKPADETKKEVIEEVKEEIIEAQNGCGGDEKKEEVSNEEPTVVEETKTEVIEEKQQPEVKEEEEEEKKEETKAEVIKLEALNNAPKTEGIDVVKNSAPAALVGSYAIVKRVI